MTDTVATPRQRSRKSAPRSFRENYLALEQEYRHEMGRASVALARRAQVFAFVLAGLFLSAGTASILLGHDVAGAAIAVTASVSLATAFLAGNRAHAQAVARNEADADQADGESPDEEQAS